MNFLSFKKHFDEEQTKLLEINLTYAPLVADAIFESNDFVFTQYDRLQIARLCERAQLYQRALQHYENIDDIKHVLQVGLVSNSLKLEFIVDFFGDLTPFDGLSCMNDMLKYPNSNTALQVVVEIAKRYEQICLFRNCRQTTIFRLRSFEQ